MSSNEKSTAKSGWSLKYMMKAIGPSLLLSGVTLGPSSLVNSVNTGANYGFSLIWWLFVICMMGVLYQVSMNRYSIVTGKTFCMGVRDTYGSIWGILCGLMAIAQSTVFMIGNFVGSGLAVNLIFPGVPTWLGGTVILVISFLFLLFKNLYQKLELLFKILLFVMLAAFVIILAVSGQADPAVVSTKMVDFSGGKATFGMMLTLLGATFSLAGAAWTTSLTQDKKLTMVDVKKGGVFADAFFGFMLTFIVCTVLILVGAKAFGGMPITNGAAFGIALGEAVGPWARYVVGIGFLAICLSTVVVCPQLGTSVMLQGLGKDSKMEAGSFKFTIVVSALMFIFAAIVGSTIGHIPATVLRFAAWAGIIATPLYGIFTIMLCNDKKQMGEHVISKKQTVVLAAIYVVLMIMVIMNIKNQIVSLM